MANKRWPHLAGWLAIALICTFGLGRISFDVQLLSLLPGGIRQVESLKLFLAHFGRPAELVLTIEAPGDAALATQSVEKITAALRADRTLAERVVDQPPWQTSGAGSSEFLAWMLLSQPPEKIRALAADLAPERAQARLDDSLEKISSGLDAQEVALAGYDPFGFTSALNIKTLGAGGAPRSEFSSADGTFRVIYVDRGARPNGYREAAAWVDRVKTAARAAAPPGVALGFTGEPAFVAEIASGMEGDMHGSAIGTLAIVALIYFLCHRRFMPLLVLNGVLGLGFVTSLALAGLLPGQLTAVGVGFAAIMIGLAVDYGFLLHEEARGVRTVGELRAKAGKSIFWAALTTVSAFLTLLFSSMPGLRQLGLLVGLGVACGAIFMMWLYAAYLAGRVEPLEKPRAFQQLLISEKTARLMSWLTALCCLAALAGLVWRGLPGLNSESSALGPRHCEAQIALEKLAARLGDERLFLNIIVRADGDAAMLERLRQLDADLAKARADGLVAESLNPVALWPDGVRQKANLPSLAALAAELPRLQSTASAAGFTDDALALTNALFAHWQRWAAAPPTQTLWPADTAARWMAERAVSHLGDEKLAIGMVRPAEGRRVELVERLDRGDTRLAAWRLLGEPLREKLPREFGRIIVALLVVIAVLTALAFRSWREVVLIIAVLALVFATLLGAMSLFGWQWNYFNLAVPLLLLGTGVDYSIHILIALRRGDSLAEVRGKLGQVIFLCAGSTVAGFGSLAWASNLGLASLGKLCAFGIGMDAVISVFLLPIAWRAIGGRPTR